MKKIIITGIRGVPAQHGGFETFAEHLYRHLVARKWKVVIYCQEDGIAGPVYQSEWEGVTRIHVPVKRKGPIGTIIFDLKSVLHSLQYDGVFLTLGYNTAMFNFLYRMKGKKNIINMDGIEWKRQKWGRLAKIWFWLNEGLGCFFGNALIADHPCIVDHLAKRASREKITMIPYGGDEVLEANEKILNQYSITKKKYAILIARAEPENSIFELVSAFSAQKRGINFVILGNYDPDVNIYHQKVIDAASEEVLFLGAIYDTDKIRALRFFAQFYVHGHQVGGTNPSLVEALGAGNAILAHNNIFNRWVAKDAAIYFNDLLSLEKAFEKLIEKKSLIEMLESKAAENFLRFKWDKILAAYEQLLLSFL
ncbi:MAG: DUF1972 domain-containing protein [Candidatus Electrothrix communis]|nr:MAG: DUF1972 domain-containing protein [Candidatus Electrothrix communis]